MSDSNLLPFPLPQDAGGKDPLPEEIARKYHFPLAYYDVDDARYYSIQDWIAGVAQAAKPRTYWNNLKNRIKKAGLQLSPPWGQLPYQATNGKTYKMDFAVAATLYQITQRMDANTGLRNDVLAYLAKSGVVVDVIRIDPEKAIDAAIEAYRREGKSEASIAARIQGKAVRLRFTAAFSRSMRSKPSQWHYAAITDEMRLGLWKRKTAQIKAEMGMSKNANLRENLGSLALSYELLAENLSAAKMEQKQSLEFYEVKAIVRRDAEDVGEHAARQGRILGIDIVTNRPLLSDKNQ